MHLSRFFFQEHLYMFLIPLFPPQMYNFTNFAMFLNELEPGMDAILASTDCRFRPDIRAMENGNMGNLIKKSLVFSV